MIALSRPAFQLLADLRAHSEGCDDVERDGIAWRNVYLDNVPRRGLTPRQFAWHLSQLSHVGLYRPIDGDAWGDVAMQGAT